MTEIVIGVDASTRLLMQAAALVLPVLSWVAVSLVSLVAGLKIAELVARQPKKGTK